MGWFGGQRGEARYVSTGLEVAKEGPIGEFQCFGARGAYEATNELDSESQYRERDGRGGDELREKFDGDDRFSERPGIGQEFGARDARRASLRSALQRQGTLPATTIRNPGGEDGKRGRQETRNLFPAKGLR